jgi:hypothetical protein
VKTLSRRGVLISGLLFAGALGVGGAMRSTAAPPAGCDNWTGLGLDNLWSNVLNWSNGVPDSTKDACILGASDDALLQSNGAAKSLTLGGASGTATLHVQGNVPGGNAQLNLGSASDVTAHGVLSIEATSGQYSLIDGAGPLTNHGTYQTLQGASGGVRYLRIPLINAAGATVSIGAADTRQDTGSTATNNGVFKVAAGGGLSMTGGSTFNNNAGTMPIAATGSVTGNGVTFNQGGTTVTGGPVTLYGSNLAMVGAGAGSFSLQANNNLSGNTVAGQTVTVQGSTSGGNSTTTVVGNVTNGGTLAMDATGGQYALIGGSGTLTNNGTFKTLQGGAGGTRYVRINLTNNAAHTVSIGAASTVQDQATTTTNKGAFTVLAGGGYGLSGGATFNNSAGTVTLAATGPLTGNGATFMQGGGAITGGSVTLFNSTLQMTGAGAGSIILQGGNNLSGNTAPGQSVTVQGSGPGGNAVTTVLGNMTNGGTLALGALSGQYALITGSGTITNTGTFKTVQGPSGGTRYVRINLTNAPGHTISIGGASTVQDQATTTTNNGAFNVPAGGVYALFGGAILNNNAGSMSLATPQTVYASGATFKQGGTAVTGGPVLIVNGTLQMVGAGAGSFSVQASSNLSGNIAAGQTVTLQGSVPGGNSTVTVPGAFTNAGNLVLDSDSGQYALLQTSTAGAVVTNKGTFKTNQGATAGTRYIRMGIANQPTGIVRIDSGSSVMDVGTALTNAGQFALGSTGNLGLSSGSSFVQSSAGNFVDNVDVPNSRVGLLQGNASTPVALAGKFTVVTAGTPATGSDRTVISGVPRSGTFTSYNMNGAPYSVQYPADGVVLHTEPLLVITTASPLPSATPGAAYSTSLAATGGIPPRAWSLASGTLPPGLTLSAAGVISGTPTTPGTSTFTVKVTDSGSPPQAKTKAMTLTVNPWCSAGTFPTYIKGNNVPTQGQPTGVYLWVSPDGVWHLVAARTGAGASLHFTGTVTTTGTIKQVAGYKLENAPGNMDTFSLNAAKKQITYSFTTANDVDGINFVSSCNGTVTFNLQQNGVQMATTAIYFGAVPHTHPATNPFNVALPPSKATRYP